MRVVHVSSSDAGGGAARAAYRLHAGLRRIGVDSRMLVARRLGSDPDVIAFAPATDLIWKLRRRVRARRIRRDFARYQHTRPPGLEPFSDDRTEHAGQLARQIPSCDVINLHWVAGLLDYQGFFRNVADNVTLVWRLADMAALTGGCHYDENCGRFREQCGCCPQLGSSDEHDLSRQIWQRKSAGLSRLRPEQLHIVGTSQWIAKQASASSLLSRFGISVIPNGLDTDDFAPRDKRFSRQLWGIPQDARVVLFAAESIINRRKGLKRLADALAKLKDVPGLLLVSVGGGDFPNPDVPHLALGRIVGDRALSTVYSAADVFVIPSLQESFGQTVIEAMACGTPVIGFDTGGIPDMVRPGQTGWLVPTGDVESLAQTIGGALAEEKTRLVLGENGRRIAIQQYSLDVQARAYLRLYETVRAKLIAPVPAGVKATEALSPA